MTTQQAKDRLEELIKVISNNSYRIFDWGVSIRKNDINHKALAKHKDELLELCLIRNKVFQHLEDVFENKMDVEMGPDGTLVPVMKKVYVKNKAGYNMMERITIGKPKERPADEKPLGDVL